MVAQMFLFDVREPMISYIVSHKHVWASTRTNEFFFLQSLVLIVDNIWFDLCVFNDHVYTINVLSMNEEMFIMR